MIRLTHNENTEIHEKKQIFISIYIPVVFIVLIWLIKLIEITFNISLGFLGINPRNLEGLIGIITSPLIHKDFNHLMNNSVPLLLFSVGTIYFYRPIGIKIIALAWLMTGIWVWCGAREAYHIGASGVVYGLASFLVVSGAIRRIPGLAALSLIVIFLYGSMIWGIFPFIPDVSWESHLSGGIAGLTLALIFRKHGPQPKQYWIEEPEEEIHSNESDENTENTENRKDAKIVYLYKPDKKEDIKDDTQNIPGESQSERN